MLYWASYLFPTVKFASSFGTYPVSLRRSGLALFLWHCARICCWLGP